MLSLSAYRARNANRQQLRQVALFAECSDAELDVIDHNITPVHITAGDVIAHAGQAALQLMVLADGRVRVERDGDTVTELTPGAVIGETALLSHRPATADLIAATDLVVLVLGRTEFNTVMYRCPTVAAKIEALHAERLSA